jgi:hypothetical protein
MAETDIKTEQIRDQAVTESKMDINSAPTHGYMLYFNNPAGKLDYYGLEESTTYANEVPTGAVNGINVTYTLQQTPHVGRLMLFLNGVLQKPGEDYSLSGVTITMTTAPESGDQPLAWYMAQSGLIYGNTGYPFNPVVKTSGYTASAWDEVFADTSGGIFTVLLPATPSLGDTIRFINIADSWEANNLTIGRNGKKIKGASEDLVVDLNESFSLQYSNVTWGWVVGL